MVALLLIGLIVVVFGGLLTLDYKRSKAVGSGIPLKILDSTDLSPVASEVYREYMRLPVDSRPFGDNIKDILKSLDVTLRGVPGFKYHFDDNYHMRQRGFSGWEHHKFSWTADIIAVPGYTYHERCPHRDCDFKAYYELHTAIEDVQKALDNKTRALILSENASNVALADELVKALRDEAGIHNKAVERIKEIG